MTSLNGKIAIITGAGRGIGRTISLRLAQEKAKIVLVDLNDQDLASVEKEVISAGGQVLSIRADVTQSQEVTHMITEALNTFSTVDILINNAGIIRDASLLKMTEKDFDAVIAVNLKGVFLCTQACAQIMSQKKYGKIVNLSSIAKDGNYGQTNYAASKAGVAAMTRTWALELSRFNINVNAIAPGLIATDMTAKIPEAIKEKMVKMIPLRREGQTSDIAELACFLASDASSYIQGEVITISGGFKF